MDRLTRIVLAVLSLAALVLMTMSSPRPFAGASVPATVSAGRLVPAGSMEAKRADHTSTLLPDGRVLIAGGMVENGVFLNSAELYDPAKDVFLPTGAMQSRRVGHSATLLTNGKVLIAGGLVGRVFEGGPGVVASTEIYDPATGQFTPGPPMTTPRGNHAAVLLKNGRVLLVGGSASEDRLASAEIYDPRTGKSIATGSMHWPRVSFAAALLKDGRVLVTGGSAERRKVLATTELYDPASGKWSRTGDMTLPRHKHAATLLADGRVLITGGSDERDWNGQYRSAEIFDPATGRFTPCADMEAARFKIPNATATLKNGNVLVAGGAREVEVYDVATGKFLRAGSLDEPHYFSGATLLADGRVLITGGYGTGHGRSNGPLSTERSWIYQP